MNISKYIRRATILLLPITYSLLPVSCSSFFEPDTDSVLKTEEQTYSDELTVRNGLFGLLQGMQEIGETNVLMGELRGDLMTTTDNSSQELRDIAEFNIDNKNTYLKERKYYALVNNCNYYITHLDTIVTKLKDDKAYQFARPYMAQAKAIRAWTYLNMCLDYGKVQYTDHALLNAEDKAEQTMTLEDLLPVLIKDMESALSLLDASTATSASDLETNDPGFTSSTTYASFAARQLMLPLHFVLGELYLWKATLEGDGSAYYVKAAEAYYWLIKNDQLKMCAKRNMYNDTGDNVTVKNWQNLFSNFDYVDVLTAIAYGTDYDETQASLYAMAGTQYVIAPSSALINTFNSVDYYTNRAIAGDLRGLYGTYYYKTQTVNGSDVENAYIDKFNKCKYSSQYYVTPCRSALIYLRYAEAVNRIGKPKFVFNGFLKYGLCGYNLKLYSSKFAGELTGESCMNFGQNEDENTGVNYKLFSDNRYGFHARGCGKTDMNEAYVIEEQATLQDTIQWVEDQLVTEYALETALEGNRFHDLMRIAIRRNNPDFLAEKVSEKFSTAKRAAIRTKLQDKANWYLPEE